MRGRRRFTRRREEGKVRCWESKGDDVKVYRCESESKVRVRVSESVLLW